MQSLYKEGIEGYNQSPANDSSQAERPEFDRKEIIALLMAERPLGDAIIAPAELSPLLSARADELMQLYQGIFSRPAPVWEFHPVDALGLHRPDYLFLRKQAQIMTADGFLRLGRGDGEGAAMALAAGLRLSESLEKNPLLISFMIRTAIEGLFASVAARLPAEPGAWERMAIMVDAKRAAFKNCIQADSLFFYNMVEGPKPDFSLYNSRWNPDANPFDPVPRWFRRLIESQHIFLRLEQGRSAMAQAGYFNLLDHQDFLHSKDLGAQEMDDLCHRYPSIAAPNLSRAWARVNVSLLLQEQAVMIRYSRAQMTEGKTQFEHASVVVPGAKWEATPDGSNHSISLKLTPTPLWAIKSPVIDGKFFLLPLDGSKSWQFTLP